MVFAGSFILASTAQHLHRTLDSAQHLFDFCRRVRRIHRKPDHLSRWFRFWFHRLDNVGRLIGIGKARRAGRRADAFLIEQQQQRLGFDSVESDVGSVGQSLRFVAVQFRVGNRTQNAIFNYIAQRTHTLWS